MTVVMIPRTDQEDGGIIDDDNRDCIGRVTTILLA